MQKDGIKIQTYIYIHDYMHIIIRIKIYDINHISPQTGFNILKN